MERLQLPRKDSKVVVLQRNSRPSSPDVYSPCEFPKKNNNVGRKRKLDSTEVGGACLFAFSTVHVGDSLNQAKAAPGASLFVAACLAPCLPMALMMWSLE